MRISLYLYTYIMLIATGYGLLRKQAAERKKGHSAIAFQSGSGYNTSRITLLAH